MSLNAPNLADLVREQITVHTGRRVQDLVVEVGPARITLRGRAKSFHVKQLAQHGVRVVAPTAPLQNAIVVE